jgi:hypothetical protein
MQRCLKRVFTRSHWRTLRRPVTAALSFLLLHLTSGCGAVRSVWPWQTDRNDAQVLLRKYYQCAATYGHDREQLKTRCEPYVAALKNWRAARGEPQRTEP